MNAGFEAQASAQKQSIYDVIISGAGPVGLFLAAELALAGCSVLVLEKAGDSQSPLKQLPFGMRGLSTPTIDALYRRGLLEELELHKQVKDPHSRPVEEPATRRQAGHFAGIPFYAEDIDTAQWPVRLPGAPGTHLLSEIAELERVFTRRTEALGVRILRGLAVTGVEQNADVVTVEAGGQCFTARWLVGCDGARSAVRKAAGFAFAGTEPEFTGYSARIDLADSGMLLPGRNITAEGMYLQSQPGYIILQDFDEGAFHNSGEPVTPDHLQAVLRRITGTDATISTLHIVTTWTDRARQATTYRKGRILLAGDAAHIHSPLGGQGLNLGLGDAMNLGWKLAATLKGRAPEDLLGSYTTERHSIGALVLDWSRAQVALMRPAPNTRALREVVGDLIHTPDGATYIAGRVWGLHMAYPHDGDHPLAGHSLPDFSWEDGSRTGSLMQDGRGMLLDFEGYASLKTLAESYGLKYVAGSVRDRLGLNALLVRPDGFVAWAADNAPDMEALQKAADRWFVRSAV
ncbi:FAD-dependent oxidoreductase [Taibaiella helva]|uniref:FAD-dependent oxidoreductase n=1 Tax=Taibaiella helva TaxID=2301235 RepID=UPI000E586DA9|nr:FAD-dependent oxidoreductase [Taibaiella helva]